MGFFSFLSSSPKVVDDIMDKDKGLLAQVGGWIGNMNLTPEEVMKQNAKTVSSVQTFVVATLAESSERSKTRRDIAVMWFKLQAGVILMCCLAAPWDLELAKFYFTLATSTLMVSVTVAITVFFFGSHGLARYNESKK